MDEIVIWRPVARGMVSIADVNRGDVPLEHLIILNGLLDAQDAAEAEAANQK